MPSVSPVAKSTGSDRLMWITADRVFYFGLLGSPTVRQMGSVLVYVSVAGSAIRIRLEGGEWQRTEMAVVPPYVPHQVMSESRMVNVVKVEAETVDLGALPLELCGRGAMDAPEFVSRVRERAWELPVGAQVVNLLDLDFDLAVFGAKLPTRIIDRRILAVLGRIKSDPSAPAVAKEYAAMAHLSFSRFLHLFKQEVGAPFRSFRTWKRARNLLNYVVHKDCNLSYIALDTGYPDSTHFSHSIRQVYGLKPSEIFAGSRRLAVHCQTISMH